MPRRKRPVLGVDYVIDPDGRAQFTREYLKKRGDCCENACRYCPYTQPNPSRSPSTHDTGLQALQRTSVS